MSKPYYASFFVHDAHQEAVTQYCGVIEMRRRNNKEIGPRELAVLLAKNLDVETDDVEVLQWGLPWMMPSAVRAGDTFAARSCPICSSTRVPTSQAPPGHWRAVRSTCGLILMLESPPKY
jgi:hypothetical protein